MYISSNCFNNKQSNDMRKTFIFFSMVFSMQLLLINSSVRTRTYPLVPLVNHLKKNNLQEYSIPIAHTNHNKHKNTRLTWKSFLENFLIPIILHLPIYQYDRNLNGKLSLFVEN